MKYLLILGVLVGALQPVVGTASAAPAFASVAPDERPLRDRVVAFFFAEDHGVPVVHLDAFAIDSIGTAISHRNLDLARRVNEAYEAGYYGSLGSSDARHDALAAFTYRTETTFDFFLGISLQEEVIYTTSEADLIEAFTERFRNPGLYPIVNLRAARAGFGAFCMEFDVENPEPREVVVTGGLMRGWTEEIDFQGRRERVVIIDMKTMSHDRVRLGYRRYACGTVRRQTITEAGRKLTVATMEDVSGQFVRKWGWHEPRAVILWRSVVEGLDAPPADHRRMGSAIYFPRLKLELPWFLPDIGCNDLRRFDFPEALLTINAVEQVRAAEWDWLTVGENLRFGVWDGEGDVPEFVLERFPDQ